MNLDSHHMPWKGHDLFIVRKSDLSGSTSIFYAPSLRLALLIDDPLAARIRTGSLPQVIQNKLEMQLPHFEPPVIARPKSFHLALGLTENCTLGCLYCHAEAGKSVEIDPKLLSHAFEYAFARAGETPNKTLTVSFAVGGEPTMNWGLFKRTVDRIRDLERNRFYGVEKVFLSMTTNGYYGDRKRRYIADNFDTLTLSLDGSPQIHNLHRPTRNGTDSYSLVAQSCKYFLGCSSVRTGLRGTVSAYSVKFLREIVEHYHSEFGCGYTVSFEPLIQVGRALQNTCLPSPSNEEFAHNFWAAQKRGQELDIRVITSAANINRFVRRYCGAMSIPSFTLCTSGSITACHRDQDATDYGYGRIDPSTGQVRIEEERLKSNIRRSELPDYCLGCFAKWHCAGDCPDIRRIGYSRCDINRFLVFEQLFELLKKKKGGEGNGERCYPN